MLCRGLQSRAGWFKSIPRLHFKQLFLASQGLELGGHGGITSCEFLDTYILRFIVGKSQVAVCAKESFLGFLKVIDRFVDFVNRRLKPP